MIRIAKQTRLKSPDIIVRARLIFLVRVGKDWKKKNAIHAVFRLKVPVDMWLFPWWTKINTGRSMSKPESSNIRLNDF